MTTADKAYLRKWNGLWPNAITLDLANAGHFWQEDEPVAAANAIISAYAAPSSQTTTNQEEMESL